MKTSIEEIDPDKEDETVKEFKKIAQFDYDDDPDLAVVIEKPYEKKEIRGLQELSEQDNQDIQQFVNPNIKSIPNLLQGESLRYRCK